MKYKVTFEFIDNNRWCAQTFTKDGYLRAYGKNSKEALDILKTNLTNLRWANLKPVCHPVEIEVP